MKRVALVGCLLLASPFATHANVTCSGVPERIYAGAHGPNDAGSKLWVVFAGWQAYSLGHHTDSMARARLSLAQTAMATGKSLELSFFDHATCEQARTEASVPTAVALAP